MRFLIDAQLPPAMARMIVTRGFGAEHVQDIGLASATDVAIWRYAAEKQAVIVTKDDDFVSLRTVQADGPAIVWIRLGNTSRKGILLWFEPLFPAIVGALARGEKLIEVV